MANGPKSNMPITKIIVSHAMPVKFLFSEEMNSDAKQTNKTAPPPNNASNRLAIFTRQGHQYNVVLYASSKIIWRMNTWVVTSGITSTAATKKLRMMEIECLQELLVARSHASRELPNNCHLGWSCAIRNA
eukprot:105795-Amphidinium_carterae.1